VRPALGLRRPALARRGIVASREFSEARGGGLTPIGEFNLPDFAAAGSVFGLAGEVQASYIRPGVPVPTGFHIPIAASYTGVLRQIAGHADACLANGL
jgi:hypothetical protein